MRMVRILGIQAHVQIAWHALRDPDGCVYVYAWIIEYAYYIIHGVQCTVEIPNQARS